MKLNQLGIVCAILTGIIFITSCAAEKADLPIRREEQYHNQLIEIEKNIKSVQIALGSGNVEVYSWNKKEIKCEVRYIVTDQLPEEQLKKLLDKFSIDLRQKDGTLYVKINFKGKMDPPENRLAELKLTLPKTIKNLNVAQEFGELRIKDRYEGTVTADLNCVNAEIGDVIGQVEMICQKGNLRINGGKLYKDSRIRTETGNIYVKAECERSSEYSFITETGNVELHFPVSSNISINSFGVMQNNQFTGVDGDIAVEVSTKIGKISVNGY